MDYSTTTLDQAQVRERAFLARVYGWMSLALMITAVVATFTASTPSLVKAIFGTPLFWVLLIGEVAMVWGLNAAIGRLSAAVATAVFVIYSVLNGLTLAVIFLVYTAESVASTFFVTGATFGIISVYGYVTRRDLTSIGNLCLMALIGLILASIVNLFFASSTLYWLITFAGIAIFVGLTAYDTQKLKLMAASVDADSEEGRKGAILGALALYLDFINLMLLLLRLLGRRR